MDLQITQEKKEEVKASLNYILAGLETHAKHACGYNYHNTMDRIAFIKSILEGLEELENEDAESSKN